MKKLFILLFLILLSVPVESATKAIVPRADSEGSIGTSSKRWTDGFYDHLDVAGTMGITGSLIVDGEAVCLESGANCPVSGGGSSAFSAITGSTNTTAAMVVGSGASLGVSGTGTISATDIACTGCVSTTDIADTTIAIADLSASGTPSSSTFLRGDNQWATPAGSGDVTGPGSATDNAIVRFNGTSGTSVQNSAITIDDNGNLTTTGTATFGSIVTNGAGGDYILSTNGTLTIGGSSNEQLLFDFTPTNGLTVTSPTGLTTINFSSIALQESGNAISNATDNLGFFASTTSSQLAGVISNETGSGSLMFNSGPTVSGTLALNGTIDASNGHIVIHSGTDPSVYEPCVAGEQFQDTDATSGQQWMACESGSYVKQGDGTGAGSGAFSDASDPVVLNTTTKDVVVGAAQINTAKLSIDQDADQVAFAIQGHSTQNANIMEVENSGGTITYSLNQAGVITASGIVLGDSEPVVLDNVNIYGSGNDVTLDGTLIVNGPILTFREMGVALVENDTPVTTGTMSVNLPVTDLKTGNVIDMYCFVQDKGVTGTTTIKAYRRRGGVNAEITSTGVTIGDEWFAHDETINTSNDDLIEGDQVLFNVTGVHTTPPNGLECTIKIDRALSGG